MKFGDTFRIASRNLALLGKTFLTQLITLAIVVGLAFVSLNETISGVAETLNRTGILLQLQNVGNTLFSGNFEISVFEQAVSEFLRSIEKAVQAVPDFYAKFTVSYLAFFVALTIGKYLNGFADLPICYCLNEFMSASVRGHYVWAYFKYFGHSALYYLFYMLLSFPMDLLIFAGAVGLYLLFLSPLGLFGVILALALFLVFYAGRIALFSMWLPTFIDEGNGVGSSLKNGLKNAVDVFPSVFWKTLVCVAVAFALMLIALITLPLGWFAGISVVLFLLTYFLLKCLNMVEYFSLKGKKYFKSKIRIDFANPEQT